LLFVGLIKKRDTPKSVTDKYKQVQTVDKVIISVCNMLPPAIIGKATVKVQRIKWTRKKNFKH